MNLTKHIQKKKKKSFSFIDTDNNSLHTQANISWENQKSKVTVFLVFNKGLKGLVYKIHRKNYISDI